MVAAVALIACYTCEGASMIMTNGNKNWVAVGGVIRMFYRTSSNLSTTITINWFNQVCNFRPKKYCLNMSVFSLLSNHVIDIF